MSTDHENELREKARESLERMQSFPVENLPREKDLGKAFHFQDAVEPASRLVDLFERLSASSLDDFPQSQLEGISNQANACYNIMEEIAKFDPTDIPDAISRRDSLVQKLEEKYQEVFDVISPLVGYSLHKTADFPRLETEARTSLQQIRDEAGEITKGLGEHKQEAEKTLEAIRSVALEQGATQQAIYFKKEADENEKEAKIWQDRTSYLVLILTLYAVVSIGFHKFAVTEPISSFEAIQLAISKILIFAVLSYGLHLCAKNFLSYKHNAIVNRHRQNALQTYRAIVKASGDERTSDAILLHAAACIYSPQPTGYAKGSADGQSSARSVIELLSKPLPKDE